MDLVSGNITHNDTNNLVNNNHTIEITDETLDFELEHNNEPKRPLNKIGNVITMKETGTAKVPLFIALITSIIIFLILVLRVLK